MQSDIQCPPLVYAAHICASAHMWIHLTHTTHTYRHTPKTFFIKDSEMCVIRVQLNNYMLFIFQEICFWICNFTWKSMRTAHGRTTHFLFIAPHRITCYRQNNVLNWKDAHTLMPRNCEYVTGHHTTDMDTAQVEKVKGLMWGDWLE